MSKMMFCAAAVLALVGGAAQAGPYAGSGVTGSLSYTTVNLSGGAAPQVVWSNDPISQQSTYGNGTTYMSPPIPVVNLISWAWVSDENWTTWDQTGGSSTGTFGATDKVVSDGGSLLGVSASGAGTFYASGNTLYRFNLANQTGAVGGFPTASSELTVLRAFTLPPNSAITFTLKAQNTGVVNDYAPLMKGLSQTWQSGFANWVGIFERQAQGGYKQVLASPYLTDYQDAVADGDGFLVRSRDATVTFTNNTAQVRQLAVYADTSAYSYANGTSYSQYGAATSGTSSAKSIASVSAAGAAGSTTQASSGETKAQAFIRKRMDELRGRPLR